jgi:hypothetical protein
MDKLKLTGQTWVEFSSLDIDIFFLCHVITLLTKQPTLKLKTWPKQLLSFLPLSKETIL